MSPVRTCIKPRVEFFFFFHFPQSFVMTTSSIIPFSSFLKTSSRDLQLTIALIAAHWLLLAARPRRCLLVRRSSSLVVHRCSSVAPHLPSPLAASLSPPLVPCHLSLTSLRRSLLAASLSPPLVPRPSSLTSHRRSPLPFRHPCFGVLVSMVWFEFWLLLFFLIFLSEPVLTSYRDTALLTTVQRPSPLWRCSPLFCGSVWYGFSSFLGFF